MLRLIVDVVIAAVAVVVITFTVQGLLFTYGNSVNPPGMDELFWSLTAASSMIVAWRAWRRKRKSAVEA